MPNTLIPIQTYTLSASAASVTFSNIPQNYTDLKVVISARSTQTGSNYGVSDISMRFNNNTESVYSIKGLSGTGSAASSFGFSGENIITYAAFGAGNDATANTFGNTELYIPNYTSTNAKSVSIDTVSETNANASLMRINAALWNPSTQAAINRIDLYALTSTSSSFLSGSTFTLYGISNGVKATGGTLTVAGGYAYHTFTSTGSFLPSQKITGAEVLCIAGGGAGGRSYGGGGGAGGLLFANSQTLTAGNLYTALIGAGGSSQSASAFRGNSGNNSVFGSSIAFGGGGGGYDAGGGTGATGIAGGSGGGGSRTFSGGAGTSGQGNRGGNISAGNFGAGGGGAGAAGGDSGSAATAGGIGSSAYSVWGAVTGTGQLVGGVYYYAGGGGGQAQAGGFGGGGQNGDGLPGTVANGTANTGGGSGSDSTASAGGSGLIIVRYPLS
jgi:hypothetical protein